MSTLDAILDGFAYVLASISSLRAYPGDPDSFNAPGVIIRPSARSSGSFGAGSGGVGLATFELVVAVKPGTLRTAGNALWAYLSDSGSDSIEAALRADTTLHNTVDDILDIAIDSGQVWGTYIIGNVEYPSGIIRVEVIY